MLCNPHEILFPSSPWNLPDDFPLRMVNHFQQPDIPLHYHNFIELAIITQGSAIHGDSITETHLVPGSVLIVFPGQTHYYRATQKLYITNIFFHQGMLKQIWIKSAFIIDGFKELLSPAQTGKKINVFDIPIEVLPGIIERLNRLYYELCLQLPGYDLLSKSIFIDLVSMISRNSPHNPNKQIMSAGRIISALSFMENNYKKSMELQTIAEAQGISKSSLIKYFNEAFGVPPMEYLTNIRLQKAIALFNTPSLNITDIAYEVGFNDSNYFSRQFRKKMKMTPSEYRNMVFTSKLK